MIPAVSGEEEAPPPAVSVEEEAPPPAVLGEEETPPPGALVKGVAPPLAETGSSFSVCVIFGPSPGFSKQRASRGDCQEEL